MILSNMILFLIINIHTKPNCEIRDGLTLVEYYKKEPSKLMDMNLNVVSKISELVTNTPLTIQKINCDKCECKGMNDFPFFRLYKMKQVLDSFMGYKSYEDLITFLSTQGLNLDKKVSKRDSNSIHKSTLSPSLIELKERDFYSGFNGPWLILFYYEDQEETTRKLSYVLKIFESRLKIGKVKHTHSQYLSSRFPIKSYPMIYGLYEGVQVPLFNLDLHNLIKFTARLVEPAFQSITKRELVQLREEPIYVVLYKDETKAHETFFRYAHNFKFKMRMFKSKDPEMMKEYLQTDTNTLTNSLTDLKLLVYKNNSYHPYEGDVHNQGTLVEWFFHTHFPNVTKITDFSIFNGLKPVFLLVTENDYLTENLEQFAKDVHLGKPYLHLLFGTIQMRFMNTIQKGSLNIPTILVYNPIDKKFYHKKNNLNQKNFKEVAEEILRLFDKGKLKPYGEGDSHKLYWILGIGGIISLGYLVNMRGRLINK